MRIRTFTSGFIAALGLHQVAWASGYQFDLQSVQAQANANANSAEASDPSTIFYNPAGLSLLGGTQISLGTTMVDPHSEFSYSQATKGNGQAVVPATTGGDYAGQAAIPHGYISHRLNEKITLGVGLFVPYGAPIDYDDHFAGRYYGNGIDFKSVAINPSMAIRLNNNHHIGFGISAQHLDVELENKIDMASVAFGTCLAGGGSPDICQPLAASYAGLADTQATIIGKDWGYGFNLGYLFTPDENTRIGLAYRSFIDHKLHGSSSFDIPEQLPGGASSPVNAGIQLALANSGLHVDINTPETFSVNAYHLLHSGWALMADVTWSRHSRLQDLRINIPTELIPDRKINYKTAWRNSLRASVGFSYQAGEDWIWRGGFMYDQTPISDPGYALTVLPDANRKMYSLGASYQLSDNTSLDFAYSYLWLKDAAINRTDDDHIAENGSPGMLNGSYSTYLNLVGLSFTYAF